MSLPKPLVCFGPAILPWMIIARDLVSAGKLLDIEVLDHIVIGIGRFVSFKDRGLGF